MNRIELRGKIQNALSNDWWLRGTIFLVSHRTLRCISAFLAMDMASCVANIAIHTEVWRLGAKGLGSSL